MIVFIHTHTSGQTHSSPFKFTLLDVLISLSLEDWIVMQAIWYLEEVGFYWCFWILLGSRSILIKQSPVRRALLTSQTALQSQSLSCLITVTSVTTLQITHYYLGPCPHTVLHVTKLDPTLPIFISPSFLPSVSHSLSLKNFPVASNSSLNTSFISVS